MADKVQPVHGEIILKFEDISFEFGHNKPILDEVDFSLRRGMKVTLMGQNGSGKSTIFGLITGHHKSESGRIITPKGLTIAIAKQVIPRPATRRLRRMVEPYRSTDSGITTRSREWTRRTWKRGRTVR